MNCLATSVGFACSMDWGTLLWVCLALVSIGFAGLLVRLGGRT